MHFSIVLKFSLQILQYFNTFLCNIKHYFDISRVKEARENGSMLPMKMEFLCQDCIVNSRELCGLFERRVFYKQ